MSERPLLRLVDDNGEITEQACPHCQEKEDALVALERKYRSAMAEITRMKRDAEAEARQHHLWDEAQAAHEWWRLACWHPGTKFAAEEFYQALPRLRERNGLQQLLQAIAGAAYDPGSRRMKNGNLEIYDDWELITRSKKKVLNFGQRVYGGADSPQWKRWLIERIESNLTKGEP